MELLLRQVRRVVVTRERPQRGDDTHQQLPPVDPLNGHVVLHRAGTLAPALES
jgi:hypothetical protein